MDRFLLTLLMALYWGGCVQYASPGEAIVLDQSTPNNLSVDYHISILDPLVNITSAKDLSGQDHSFNPIVSLQELLEVNIIDGAWMRFSLTHGERTSREFFLRAIAAEFNRIELWQKAKGKRQKALISN